MLRCIRWLLAVTLALSAYQLHAEVTVTRKFQTHPLNQAIDVKAGGYQVLVLPGKMPGDSYRITVNAENQIWRDISAFVVDERDLQLFKMGQPFRAHGRTKGVTPFEFGTVRLRNEQLYLIVDNRYSLLTTKKARVSVTMTTELSEEKTQQIKGFLETMYTGVHKILELPEFNIQMRPCNAVNAFSERGTGNITLCSESFSLYEAKPSILIWMLLHEMGHTTLGLWGIPGNDHEDMADEFATALLLRAKDGPQMIIEAMESFRNGNPYAEAQNMIQNGDRHSLSVQRVRNVREWLLNPVRVTAKWNNLLYPHMTEGALRKIAEKPEPYDNQQLAREQLANRFSSANLTSSNVRNEVLPFTYGCEKDTDCKGMRICERHVCVNSK